MTVDLLEEVRGRLKWDEGANILYYLARPQKTLTNRLGQIRVAVAFESTDASLKKAKPPSA